MMDLESPRQKMVREIREKYGLDSPKVLAAMLEIPREEFVSEASKDLAYEDEALSIGFGQTISQPYTVAFMTHLLDLKGKEKVLEIGTGSGYQAALLGHLAREVYSIERISELAKEAKVRLKRQGFKNVFVREGQGEFGWKDKAPFDAIIVTAGVEEIPQELFSQLKNGGILVAPVGEGSDKKMTRYTKKGGNITKEEFGVFNFVPLIQTD
jgi:protein-L-isoaspartate(D-aspartate) O-methyltransferase